MAIPIDSLRPLFVVAIHDSSRVVERASLLGDRALELAIWLWTGLLTVLLVYGCRKMIRAILVSLPFKSFKAGGFEVDFKEWGKRQIEAQSEFSSAQGLWTILNDQDNRLFMMILDWERRRIYGLLPGDSIVVDRAYLERALTHHSEKGDFTLEEARLRDLADKFSDSLQFVLGLMDEGVYSRKLVENSLVYWKVRIRKDEILNRVLRRYWASYEYNRLLLWLDERQISGAP